VAEEGIEPCNSAYETG